jgi:hypothetical protein
MAYFNATIKKGQAALPSFTPSDPAASFPYPHSQTWNAPCDALTVSTSSSYPALKHHTISLLTSPWLPSSTQCRDIIHTNQECSNHSSRSLTKRQWDRSVVAIHKIQHIPSRCLFQIVRLWYNFKSSTWLSGFPSIIFTAGSLITSPYPA